MEYSFKRSFELNSVIQKVLPFLMATLYPLTIEFLSRVTKLGGLRSDHFLIAGSAMLLWYLGPRFRSLFYFLLPLFLVGVVYDSMRYYADFIRGPIHVHEPYDFDRFFFG